MTKKTAHMKASVDKDDDVVMQVCSANDDKEEEAERIICTDEEGNFKIRERSTQ